MTTARFSVLIENPTDGDIAVMTDSLRAFAAIKANVQTETPPIEPQNSEAR